MARIEWAVVCDMAFFDRHDRLCVVGVTRKLVFPRLPVGLHQMMVVAHLVDIEPDDEPEFEVSFVTPSSLSTTAALGDGPSLQLVDEYMLATLHDIPFVEEGTHRFVIAMDGAPASVVEIPVLTYSAAPSEVH